jgi:hypothetical protein
MALLASAIIDAARDRHPAFDRGQTPDPSALRFLSAYARELHGRVAKVNEGALGLVHEQPLPLADFAAGIALPAHRALLEVEAVMVGDSAENPQRKQLDVVHLTQRNDRQTSIAAAWTLAGVLFLRPPAALWSDASKIRTTYVAVPIPLASLGAALALPDTAEEACTASVARFMAGRGAARDGVPPIDFLRFDRDQQRAEELYLADAANSLAGTVFYTRDVWP